MENNDFQGIEERAIKGGTWNKAVWLNGWKAVLALLP